MSDYAVFGPAKSWWKPWMGYVLAMLGFAWATVGFFNFYFGLGLPRLVFNQYSEVFVIVIYGVPTILLIKDKYQKKRLTVLVSLVFTFWYLVPTLWSFNVDLFGTNKPWSILMATFICPLFFR